MAFTIIPESLEQLLLAHKQHYLHNTIRLSVFASGGLVFFRILIKRDFMPRVFTSAKAIEEWVLSLDERWPERLTMREQMIKQLHLLPSEPASIVEYCSGDGSFARQLQEAFPKAQVQGLDSSSDLNSYARQQGASSLQFHDVDMRREGWIRLLPNKLDLVITLQSLHDLGGADEIANIYLASYQALTRGGIAMITDFMPDEIEFSESQPGRLPVTWHLEKLASAGFHNVKCSIKGKKLRCCIGLKT